MRVLVHHPGEHLTGAGRYAASICAELAERGHEVLAAVHGDGPSRELFQRGSERVRVERVDTPNLGRRPGELVAHLAGIRAGSRRIAGIIDAFEPDVLLAHCVYNLWSALAARRASVPRVALLHELPGTVPAVLYRFWMRSVAGTADRVIVSSEEMARSVPRDSGRVAIVRPGVDAREFHSGVDGRKAREELGAAGAAPLLVSVFHLMEAKGQLDLVEAIPALVEDLPAILVAFVGGTNGRESNRRYLDRLRERVRTLGVDDHIRFTGERTDVAPWLAAADLVVCTSRHESFGMVPVEAQALGVPVVATDVGIARELARGRPSVAIVPKGQPARIAAAIRESLPRKRDPRPLERQWTVQGSVDAIEATLTEAVRG